MTAYAQEITNTTFGTITWELRSLNHRYLEFYFRLPENLRDLEYALRETARSVLVRGKLDCSLKLEADSAIANNITVDDTMVHSLMAACNQVSQSSINLAPISPLDVLRWPGVIKTTEQDQQKLAADLKQSFAKALNKLKLARQQEGEQLNQIISNKTTSILKIIADLQKHLPEITAQQKQRLISKLEDLKINLDPNRLEQEYVLILQKSDISEEIERLSIHCNELLATCKQGTAVGKKLDFLAQELNREANTMASKSVAGLSSSAAVELKVLIEQVREQIQNIE